MGSLLHPVGSEPGRVYWMRRAVVGAGVLAVLGALFLLFRPSGSAPVAAVPDSTASVAPTPVVTPASTPPATPSATATGPVACDGTTTTLSLAGYQKVKQDAKQPFKLGITNTGKVNCVLNLASTNFALEVTSGSDRIWTTADCAKWAPAKKATLKPGKSFEFGLDWPLVRSSAGCKTTKNLLNPGTYVAAAAFSETATAKQVFTIVKAS